MNGTMPNPRLDFPRHGPRTVSAVHVHPSMTSGGAASDSMTASCLTLSEDAKTCAWRASIRQKLTRRPGRWRQVLNLEVVVRP